MDGTSPYEKMRASPMLAGDSLKSELVSVCMHAQLCQTLYDPMDCSPPGSSVHGIFQARILERVAMPPSRGSS